MYKHLFFLDSKTLDWLTPYILVLASDTIAFNVFVLTFVSAVVFNFLNSMLALMAIFLGAGYVVGFWLLILNENQRQGNSSADFRQVLNSCARRNSEEMNIN